MLDTLQYVFRKRRLKHPAETDGYFEAQGVRLYRSPFNMAWFDELRLSPRVIVDVGGFDGGDAVRFKLRYPLAAVVTFEPDPARFAIVSENAARFGVEAVPAAAFRDNAMVPWYQATHSTTGKTVVGGQGSIYLQNDAMNRRFPHIMQSTIPIHVQAQRIDAYLESKALGTQIDLLHVDAQGSELDVVIGLGAIRPAMIFVEVDDGVAGWIGAASSKLLHQRLTGMGYVRAVDCASDRLYVLRNHLLS